MTFDEEKNSLIRIAIDGNIIRGLEKRRLVENVQLSRVFIVKELLDAQAKPRARESDTQWRFSSLSVRLTYCHRWQ